MSEQPSSIGKINEPYFDKENQRVKLFLTKAVEKKEELDQIIDQLRLMKKENNAERITARYIQSDNIPCYQGIEAIIPLSNELEGYSLVYFGENNTERKSDSRVLEDEIDFAHEISKRPIVSPEDIYSRVRDQGYTLHRLDEATHEDLVKIAEIYTASFGSYCYELTPENVKKLICNESNVVGVIRDENGEIVSVGVAETAGFNLTLNGSSKTFRFAELSDAATLPAHRSKGLYTASSVLLHQILAEENIDYVYGEARSCNKGVNNACQRIGREYNGTLEKHCIISGTKDFPEEGPYENLNVWAVNQKRLQDLFGAK